MHSNNLAFFATLALVILSVVAAPVRQQSALANTPVKPEKRATADGNQTDNPHTFEQHHKDETLNGNEPDDYDTYDQRHKHEIPFTEGNEY
ncbi:hypothetical protein BDK51DRAFT_51176 [Blyttiomyces helicus]|uniref:Secreted protein n=1 Tax=Blyttiomyces helicus TaxID=388810 RepID=A0A4V1IRT5_9FUNG|nr:hypothetical protein BDK51DRAFT_51176 [Blyttiomyces helicus]|eukprot:RKO91177.1 hypothetical protein BDK51DRAFT_51176 [Blyttiomyces helicus]